MGDGNRLGLLQAVCACFCLSALLADDYETYTEPQQDAAKLHRSQWQQFRDVLNWAQPDEEPKVLQPHLRIHVSARLHEPINLNTVNDDITSINYSKYDLEHH